MSKKTTKWYKAFVKTSSTLLWGKKKNFSKLSPSDQQKILRGPSSRWVNFIVLF